MAINHIIVLFVETPRKFITAVINLRGVFTKQNYYKGAILNMKNRGPKSLCGR